MAHSVESMQVITFDVNIQLCEPRETMTQRKIEEKTCRYTALCLRFLAHNDVECKLRVAKAGGSTKQAALCGR